MAADSQVTCEGTKLYTSDPKVFRVGLPRGQWMVVGACGDATCDAALARVDWTGGPESWIDEIDAAAKAVGCAELGALIGHRGKLYTYLGGALWTVHGSCEAIGDGGDYAAGYMRGAAGVAPRRRVCDAVRYSGRRCTTVGGRVKLVHT